MFWISVKERRSVFQITFFLHDGKQQLAGTQADAHIGFHREILMCVLARLSLAPSNVFLLIRDGDSYQRGFAGIAFALNLFSIQLGCLV